MPSQHHILLPKLFEHLSAASASCRRRKVERNKICKYRTAVLYFPSYWIDRELGPRMESFRKLYLKEVHESEQINRDSTEHLFSV